MQTIKDIQETLKVVRESTEKVAITTQHLEQKIGTQIKTVLEIAIVVLCLVVVFVCETIDDMVGAEPLKHGILNLLEVISFIFATAILLRVCFLSYLDIGRYSKIENVHLRIPLKVYTVLLALGAVFFISSFSLPHIALYV